MAHVLELLTDIALAQRPFKTSELVELGMSKMTISRLVSEGRLQRPMRGIYRIPTETEDPNFIWACISKAYPQAVVCLLSAAVYHGLTESMGGTNVLMIPHSSSGYDEWQIEGGAQFIRTRSERDLTQGVEKIIVEKTPVLITSPERTIVDLFRFSSYVDKNGRSSFAIDPEGIQDAIGRYLDHPVLTPDTKELRALARTYGVWDSLSLVMETAQSAKARLAAT